MPETAVLWKTDDYDLDATLGCGQCFRWEPLAPGVWRGVAFGRQLTVSAVPEGLLFAGTTAAEAEALWAPYFDLNRDYAAVRRAFSADPVLQKAVAFAPGMHLLRQEPWEALCSFIFSQNNNIPRIRGIVARFCALLGEPLGNGGFAFPTPARVAALSEEALSPVRSGFRAKYVLDAARRVASGELDLDALAVQPLDEARARLREIRGVGPKVAECALLYGCGRVECFPVDVWIRRALDCLYPRGFPTDFGPVAGIAQQYLFHYARSCPTCGLR